MKKYLLTIFILAFAACTNRESSNNNESSQSPDDSTNYGNNNSRQNNGNGTSILDNNKQSTIVAADFISLLVNSDGVNYQDTGKRKVHRQRSASYGSGTQNNAGRATRKKGTSNKKVKNDQPAGNPVGQSGSNYDPSEGLKPDTNAKGTRVGNTYKSGNYHGQYQKVVKPSTDTTKVKQLHTGGK
jgi:hypothetical protein